ncbi:MAG: metalloregulator ArsR/SmtB family transcription factor [Desulfobulbaceae bacterium]|nr:metalloregulator ArsR/SmtB family transcription factor [Desulfobulbaceae bacterium]
MTAQLFKALSEEVRLRIMALLIEGELCVCDLMEVLDLPQSTISRHLAYLRNGGLVAGERRGVWMYYRLADGKNELAKDLLRVLSDHLLLLTVIRQDRKTLARYLAEKKTDSCR